MAVVVDVPRAPTRAVPPINAELTTALGVRVSHGHVIGTGHPERQERLRADRPLRAAGAVSWLQVTSSPWKRSPGRRPRRVAGGGLVVAGQDPEVPGPPPAMANAGRRPGDACLHRDEEDAEQHVRGNAIKLGRTTAAALASSLGLREDAQPSTVGRVASGSAHAPPSSPRRSRPRLRRLGFAIQLLAGGAWSCSPPAPAAAGLPGRIVSQAQTAVRSAPRKRPGEGVAGCYATLWRKRSWTPGAPAKNQTATRVSVIPHPAEEMGERKTMGLGKSDGSRPMPHEGPTRRR